MMHFARVSRLATLFLAPPALASAGIDVWTADGGPYGGRIHALHALSDEPRTTYAATERGGVFRSRGDELGWASVNEGLTFTDVLCLTSHPLRSDTLFAGTGGGGVYRTTDGGGYWSTANQGFTSLFINALLYTPDGSRIYAATSGGGVFLSDTDGLGWTPSNTGLTDLSVRSLAISPSSPHILYAGTGSGVFRSLDAGSTWTHESDGLAHPIVAALALHPADSNVVYAGTLGGGVYKTTDGGDNWIQSASAMATAYVRGLTINPAHPETVWAATNRGVFESLDGAASWTRYNAGLVDTTAQAILYTADTLYAGGYWGGVAGTHDPSSGWTPMNQSLTNRFVQELAVSPLDPTRIWAASYGGLSYSTDRGDMWVDSYPAVDTFDFRTVALSPDDQNEILAGAFYGGVIRSSDGGSTWQVSSSGLGAQGTVTSIRYKQDQGTVVLCGTYGGTYKSTNSGASWSLSSTGMGNKKVWGMATVPTAPSLVYVGTYGDGVYRSNNFGGSWQSVPIAESYARAVAIDPSDTAVVYVGGYYQQSGLGGVYKTTDGGASWVSKNNGLGNRSVWWIAIDPLDTSHLLAATIEGIYESHDGAELWGELSDGLLPQDVRCVGFSGYRLLAGSYGGSAPWYEDVSTSVSGGFLPSGSALSVRAYPNPFNATTTVHVTAGAGPLRLAIYDGPAPPDSPLAATWDGLTDAGRPVSSGVYFGLATSSTERESQSLVLVR